MKPKNMGFRRMYSKLVPRTDYLTHGMHRYTAKLIPHIPRYLIENYTSEGDVVLDPFCGSGTTLLEARLLSRNAVGIDINPLAVLISAVKTKPLDMDELRLAIRSVKKTLKNHNGTASVQFPNIDYWFCKKAQNELLKIKTALENVTGNLSESIRRFLLVCFSSIVRKSSYGDPRMAKTYKSKRVIEKIKSGWMPAPIEYFQAALNRNFESIGSLSEYLDGSSNYVKVFQGDARETSAILGQNGINQVEAIITSPPYINAQDYFRSYKLELWWLGLATAEEVRSLNRKAIGTERISGYTWTGSEKSRCLELNRILNKIRNMNKTKSQIVRNYFLNMEDIFEEFHDVLEVGGHFCLVTGNNTICGIQIPTYKILTQIAGDIGFELVEVSRDEIKNRLLAPSRNHQGGIIKEEWITVFRKRE